MAKESGGELEKGMARCVCCGKAVKAMPRPRDPKIIRGVCLGCRSSMRRLVNAKRTTWEKLEAAGLMLPRGDHKGTRQVMILKKLEGA